MHATDEKAVRASRNPSLVLTAPRDSDRRRHGRIQTEAVTCSMGDVVDMSASGVKVRRKGRRAVQLGDSFTITLKYGQFALPVDVRVVRLQKIGFRRYIFGLEFLEVNEHIRAKLAQLACVAATQRILLPEPMNVEHP